MAFSGEGALGGGMSGAATGTQIGGPGWGTAIGAVGGAALGGFLGGKKGSSAAEKAAKEALSYYASIGIPPIEAQQLVVEELKSQGVLTPELESDILQGRTEFETVSVDPSLKKAQMEALANMERRYSQGLTEEEQAAITGVRRDTAQQARAADEAILQNMAQRGMSGAGAELAARLQAGQSAADRQSEEDMKMAALISQARKEAAESTGRMAGDVRSQDFEEQAKRASAQDAINAFNVQGRQNVQQRNIGAKNEAQAMNLKEKQRLADANVMARMEAQKYNKELLQKEFENKVKLADSKAAARTGQIGNQLRESQLNQDKKDSMFSNIFGGASNLAGAYNTYKKEQAVSQSPTAGYSYKPKDEKEAADIDAFKKWSGSGV